MLPKPFETALVGHRISHVWRGYGSALFLELGALTPRVRRDGSVEAPSGQTTVMIEWSWRIERPKSILGGSWSHEQRWPGMFKKLQGTTVTAARLFGALPELELSLSNGLRVVSFMTAEGQPEWAVISRKSPKATLSVRRGVLHVEKLTHNSTLKSDAAQARRGLARR